MEDQESFDIDDIVTNVSSNDDSNSEGIEEKTSEADSGSVVAVMAAEDSSPERFARQHQQEQKKQHEQYEALHRSLDALMEVSR